MTTLALMSSAASQLEQMDPPRQQRRPQNLGLLQRHDHLMAFADTLDDHALLDLLHRCGTQCARIMAMPDTERTHNGPKGAASPEQAGQLSAFFAYLASREAHRRGLLTDAEMAALH